MSLDARLQRIWYGQSAARWLLAPLSVLFGIIVRVRRSLYRRAWLSTHEVGVPVIVIGNVTVGGTGKTPLTIWLANELQRHGLQPGIVLRGYKGRSAAGPRSVRASDDAAVTGDEAVLLAGETSAIVVVAPDRAAAARRAVELGADIVLSDDGLQHYALARDCEIAVLDAGRLLGNGQLLPAGPLREPATRLAEVDFLAVNERSGAAAAGSGDALRRSTPPAAKLLRFKVSAGHAVQLVTGERRELASFRGQLVHALAGIGHPEAFFASLEQHGLAIVRHAPGDHAALTRAHLDFGDDAPVLMTNKDAVKCRAFADRRCFSVTATVHMDEAHARELLDTVMALVGAPRTSHSVPADARHPAGGR